MPCSETYLFEEADDGDEGEVTIQPYADVDGEGGEVGVNASVSIHD